MKRTVNVYLWLLLLALGVLWTSGLVVGYSLGAARADVCTGWNGRFFQSTNCGGYQCTGFSFGPFYTQNCTEPPAPPEVLP